MPKEDGKVGDHPPGWETADQSRSPSSGSTADHSRPFVRTQDAPACLDHLDANLRAPQVHLHTQ